MMTRPDCCPACETSSWNGNDNEAIFECGYEWHNGTDGVWEVNDCVLAFETAVTLRAQGEGAAELEELRKFKRITQAVTSRLREFCDSRGIGEGGQNLDDILIGYAEFYENKTDALIRTINKYYAVKSGHTITREQAVDFLIFNIENTRTALSAASPAAPVGSDALQKLVVAGIALHNIVDDDLSQMVGYEWACKNWRKALSEFELTAPLPPQADAVAWSLRELFSMLESGAIYDWNNQPIRQRVIDALATLRQEGEGG